MSSVPQNKTELETAIQVAFEKLLADYQSIPAEMSRVKGVEGNIKGTEISICDTLAYLIGWGQLVLKWHGLKSQGKTVDFPETGFKWNQLGELATAFHQQYSQWGYHDLQEEFEAVTRKVQKLIADTSNEDLYEVNWYEKWTLGRMIQFNTSSPMKNVRTKVRRFKRRHAII